MNSNSFKNSPNQSIIAFSVKSPTRPSISSSSSSSSSSSTTMNTSQSATTTSSLSESTMQPSSSSPSPSLKISPSSTPAQTSPSTRLASASNSKPTIAPSFASTPTPTATLLPKTPSSPLAHHSGLSRGALVGIIVACVIAALLLTGLGFCLWYRKRKAQRQRISYHDYHTSEKNLHDPQRRDHPNQQPSYHPYTANTTPLPEESTTSLYNSITPFSAAAAAAASASAATTLSHKNSTKETLELAHNYSNSVLSSANGGNTTPVIDEDFWQNQKPLGTYTIIASYTQTLDDELYIQPGDKVQVYTEYDDGWCLGINLSRGGERGVFPQHCMDRQSHSNE